MKVAGDDHVQAIFTNGLQTLVPMAQQRLLPADECLHVRAVDQMVDATLADFLAVQRFPGLQVQCGDGALMFLPQHFAQGVLQVDGGARVRIARRRFSPMGLVAKDWRAGMVTLGPQVILKGGLLLRRWCLLSGL